jgi:hypothetical protein
MPRPITTNSRTPPSGVRAAAGLFVVYGVCAFLNLVVVMPSAGWPAPTEWVRALVRLVGAGLIAWGLLRLERWAWGFGLVLGLVWILTEGLVTLVVQHGDVVWLRPSGFQLLLTASLIGLGAAIALLLTPAVRAAFRASADPR